MLVRACGTLVTRLLPRDVSTYSVLLTASLVFVLQHLMRLLSTEIPIPVTVFSYCFSFNLKS